jgi:hypothetical protein
MLQIARISILGSITLVLLACTSSDSSPAGVQAVVKPPVYLLDPGLDGLAVKPEYISFRIERQTFVWIRNLHWRAWGSDIALGRGLLESCASGKCRRVQLEVRLSRRRPRDCPTGSSYTRITYIVDRRETMRPADPYICEDD